MDASPAQTDVSLLGPDDARRQQKSDRHDERRHSHPIPIPSPIAIPLTGARQSDDASAGSQDVTSEYGHARYVAPVVGLAGGLPGRPGGALGASALEFEIQESEASSDFGGGSPPASMGLSIASIASDGSGRAIPGHLRRDRSRIEKIRPGEHSRARNASLGSADGFPISAAAYESLQKSPAVSFLASFAESTLPTAEGHLGIEGDQIGSYVLGRQLDRGAFSYVVEGWTVESGGIGDEGIRHVAIKVVPKESGGGSPVVAVNASSSFPQLPGSRLSPRQHSPLQHSSSLSSLPDAAARSPAIPIAPPSAPGSQRNPSPLSLAQHRSDPELAQESLDREIAIWQRLRHPNIVRMYEVLDTEHATYIVCELADGGSLYQLLQAHPQGIPERAAWLLFRQIAEGLRYLHEDVAVCHGDLKLENVLLRTSARIEGFRSPGTSTFDHGEHRRRLFCDIGDMAAQTMDRLQVKIGDFGLSEYIGNPAQHHNDGLLAGTLAYMAPELLRRGSSSPAVSPRMLGAAGQERSPILSKAASQPELSSLSPPNASGAQPAVVTGAQDIWAAAVILFALLTGTLPFHDEFAPRLQLRILKGQYDEAALARRQVTLGARELIRRCLQLLEMIDEMALHRWISRSAA